jgi:Icc-related predicted phosphoesterase
MKFLVISDMHGNTDVLEKLDKEFKDCDGVLFAGDFAKFGHPETGTPALEALCRKHDLMYAVIGNCDEPDFLSEIERKDISIQGALVFHDGLAFAGSGGGTVHDGDTPNERTEEDLLQDLSVVVHANSDMDAGPVQNLILILHNPPKDTCCDQVAPGVHVGSALFRKFIEDYKPLAVITGHIHEGIGIDHIGDSVVINPGPLMNGNYAVMEVEPSGRTWKVVSTVLKKV